MWETRHKNYWLTPNFRHKVNSSSSENSQGTTESYKYPLMELSCKHNLRGENVMSH